MVEEGCLVTVNYGTEADPDLETFLFANRENATDDGGRIGDLDVYSPESPIGPALVGHKKGDKVRFGPKDLEVTSPRSSPTTARSTLAVRPVGQLRSTG